MSWSLGELALRFGCELRGEPDASVAHVATLAEAGAGDVSFLTNPQYRKQLATTRATAVVLTAADAAHFAGNALITGNPHATYARIAQLLYPPPPLQPGVHASASVAADARVDASAQVGAGVVIGAGADIGPRCWIGPGAVIGAGVSVGEDGRIGARVCLGDGVQIGARCVIQPGAVLGSDGFGFANERGRWLKVPQVGTVRVGDDVEIGANTTIDRGAIGDTVIEEGVKLDNLIQIAHNVRIGAHTVIAAGVGISGSTTVGRRCMIGGNVGIAGHLTIGDDVALTGASVVTHSLPERGMYSGAFGVEPARVWRRMAARFKRLDVLTGRVRRLEKAQGMDEPPQDPEQED